MRFGPGPATSSTRPDIRPESQELDPNAFFGAVVKAPATNQTKWRARNLCSCKHPELERIRALSPPVSPFTECLDPDRRSVLYFKIFINRTSTISERLPDGGFGVGQSVRNASWSDGPRSYDWRAEPNPANVLASRTPTHM